MKKHYVVKVTERDGSKSTHDVVASDSVEACIIVLKNLDRFVKIDSVPGVRQRAA